MITTDNIIENNMLKTHTKKVQTCADFEKRCCLIIYSIQWPDKILHYILKLIIDFKNSFINKVVARSGWPVLSGICILHSNSIRSTCLICWGWCIVYLVQPQGNFRCGPFKKTNVVKSISTSFLNMHIDSFAWKWEWLNAYVCNDFIYQSLMLV